MDYRNPIYCENGWIDCEINHPDYGWIPFTCDPNDTGALFDTAALFEEMKPHAAPYVPVPPTPPTQEEQEANRQAAYTQEADPLFFKYQRGEATEQEWLDKIEEIRERFPYPISN